MQFKVNKSDLQKAAAFVNGAVDTRSPLHVLHNILIDAKDGQIKLTASDLQIEKQFTVAADIKQEGSITVPSRKLLDFAKTAKSNDVSFKLNNQKASISSGKQKWSLQTIPAEEFPSLDTRGEYDPINVDSRELSDSIRRTRYAMASDDVRYYLNGMAFQIEDSVLNVVSTDGYRLAKCSIPCDGKDRSIIVPNKSIGEIASMVDKTEDIVIGIADNSMSFNDSEKSICTKLIDGKYPDWKRVIPSNSESKAVANREEIIATIDRTMPLANEKYKGVRAVFGNGMLVLSANNPDQEESYDETEIEYHGEPLEIGFNGAYLREAVSTLREPNISINLKNSNGSARIDEGSLTCVIMPMRL